MPDGEQDKEATVYIGNIDERANDALIWELMVQAGPVVNVHLPKDRVTQSHQGFGFVEFNGEVDADYAAKIMNGIRLYGKPLRVNKASADKQKPLEIGAELFIGNLDPMVDEKDSLRHLQSLWYPDSTSQGGTRRQRVEQGYGFVSYSSFDASDDAINNMNGQYLMNKDVSVQYAYKKDGKGERHGDEAERMLAAQAKKHNVTVESQPMPSAFLQTPGQAMPPAAGAPPPMAAGGFDPSMNTAVPPPRPMGFAPPGGHRPPPPVAFGMNGGPPLPGPPGRPVVLPPAPSGLPARPPPAQGFASPQNFHPGGFQGPPMPMPPPGFGPPPGNPPGFAPPPGYGR
ncbi:hypothetical protein PG994_014927 [Apiospora phragmitis]|uniref:RRM domain-containing protein n=1 Tax=Apiospora phragmitis TaxID=2905665 RepID=A0ABR1SV07_9PEZI